MKQKVLIVLLIFLSVEVEAKDTAEVITVFRADLIKIKYNSREEVLQLAGIVVPTNRKDRKTRRIATITCQSVNAVINQAKKASEYVKRLLKEGGTVTVELHSQQRNRYSQLLGYLYLPDGRMINEEILRAGFGVVLTMPPDEEHYDIFVKASQEAQEKGLGLWAK
jgi:micrococcal nuclease